MTTIISKNFNNFVPKKQAEAVFCGLGKDIWKQVYDGKFHHHDFRVFDTGKHHQYTDEAMIQLFMQWQGKSREQVLEDSTEDFKEPGYYQSMCTALDFAKEDLCEPLTLASYQKIHKLACAHFQGKKNNTMMSAELAGAFKSATLSTAIRVSLMDVLKFYYPSESSELLKEYSIVKGKSDSCSEETLSTLKQRYRLDHITVDKFKDLDTRFNACFENLKEHLENLKKSDALIASVLPEIKLFPCSDTFDVHYARADFNPIIDALFKGFEKQMQELAPSDTLEIKEKKLELIAELFQILEWLHPFEDGQGRTDLILLGKLLSEYGFTPAILDEPYVSTYVPLKQWIEYLKAGMQKWQQLRDEGAKT
jgi:hypothetical protein